MIVHASCRLPSLVLYCRSLPPALFDVCSFVCSSSVPAPDLLSPSFVGMSITGASLLRHCTPILLLQLTIDN